MTTVATVVVAVALTVATGGAGALVAGSMIATGVLGTANIAFAAADIAEGSQDVRSSQSGNLNESFNFIRDTAVEAVFGEHKQQVYNFLKAGTEIAFGVVAGAAIGNAGMIKTGGQLVCGSQKVKYGRSPHARKTPHNQAISHCRHCVQGWRIMSSHPDKSYPGKRLDSFWQRLSVW